MTERHIVVVSEVAPRLARLERVAARAFLREYRSYENRLNPTDTKVEMMKCIDIIDYDVLQDLAVPLRGCKVISELPEAGPQRAKVRSALLSPIVPRELEESLNEEESEGDDSDEEVTIPEGVPVFLRNSNAHIEAMLLQVFGPRSEDEATKML